MAYGNRYGYHRDELYFRAAARHPAFGYDDQGPMTPLLGWVSEALFGESPRGLRVFSAVVVACVVVLVALVARELGAGAGGQLVAATGTAAAAFVLAVGHLLTTSTLRHARLDRDPARRRANTWRRRRAPVARRGRGGRARPREQAASAAARRLARDRLRGGSPIRRAPLTLAVERRCHRDGCSGCRTSSGRERTGGRNSSSPPTSEGTMAPRVA